MRKILIPLDGTPFSRSIIPDARRLAGADGELILVRDVATAWSDQTAVSELEQEAAVLRADGVNVWAEALDAADIALAIDEAARVFGADMIACATHGRNALGRLARGGIAWRAVAHSTVPVLLRHPGEGPAQEVVAPRRIMVPLDGSAYAEKALPLAIELSKEWEADLDLAQVVPDQIQPAGRLGRVSGLESTFEAEARAAQAYLSSLAEEISEVKSAAVLRGPIIRSLLERAVTHGISDVVLSSHGRTGLSRALLGSVADGLIHQSSLPILVIPALAAEHVTPMPHQRDAEVAPPPETVTAP